MILESMLALHAPDMLHSTTSSFVSDGSVNINGLSAIYTGSDGIWSWSETRTTVQLFTYDLVSVSANTYGIETVNQNGQELDQIWDRVQVHSYSVDDSHVNINDIMNIYVSLIYDYDDTNVTDGTVTINGISAVHQGLGVWRIIESESIVTSNIPLL